MMKLKIHKAAMILAALVLLLPLRAVGQANTYYDRGVKPTDSRQVLKTRMALVGHNCMVSRFPDGVAVGTGVKNLSNLCDETLTTIATCLAWQTSRSLPDRPSWPSRT